MANLRKAGVSEPIGPGESLERRRRGRQTLILALLMMAGGATAWVLMDVQQDGADLFRSPIPARVAIALALLWLISIIGGSLWYKRNIDEIEVAQQLWSIAAAGSIVLILYPAWYLLWRGQMLPEPNGHIMFGALYAVMIAAYLWKKFR
jgi:hypothetical protein